MRTIDADHLVEIAMNALDCTEPTPGRGWRPWRERYEVALRERFARFTPSAGAAAFPCADGPEVDEPAVGDEVRR